MVTSWESILRMTGIGVHDNFFELGGDSLQATILLNRLQEQLGEAVPGHALFQVQTISDLAEYLRTHCVDAVRRNFPDELATPAAAGAAVDTENGSGSPHAAASIPRLARAADAEALLARLDELGDDEIELLLSQASADGEMSHE